MEQKIRVCPGCGAGVHDGKQRSVLTVAGTQREMDKLSRDMQKAYEKVDWDKLEQYGGSKLFRIGNTADIKSS